MRRWGRGEGWGWRGGRREGVGEDVRDVLGVLNRPAESQRVLAGEGGVRERIDCFERRSTGSNTLETVVRGSTGSHYAMAMWLFPSRDVVTSCPSFSSSFSCLPPSLLLPSVPGLRRRRWYLVGWLRASISRKEVENAGEEATIGISVKTRRRNTCGMYEADSRKVERGV